MKKSKRIRLKNTSIAAFGGVILSLILIHAYDTGRTSLSFEAVILCMTVFWIVTFLFIAIVASGYSERFKDGSMTVPQMYWAVSTTLVCLGVTEGFSVTFYLLTFLIMSFGLFRLTLRQFNQFCIFLIFGVGVLTLIKHSSGVLGKTPLDAYIEWGVFTFCAVGLASLCKSMAKIRSRLREKNDALSVALETKSMFLANMSHELRTPLNGVIGMLSLLQDRKFSKLEQHQLKIAFSSAKSLSVIVNDILDFTKIESGDFSLEKHNFDLNTAITNVAESTALLAQEKGIEVILDLSGVSQFQVKGDEGRVQKILQNLTSNAVKFTKEGEILIRASLEKREERLVLHCLVRDSGIGIEKDKIESVFQSFAQADGTTTRQYGGTGLGLAMVKQLCLLMEGDVRAQCELNKGCDFCFHVSLDAPDLERDIEVPEFAESSVVLIVDQSLASAEAIQAQLQVWGSEVTCVQTLGAANLLLSSENSDKVFTHILLDNRLDPEDKAAFIHAVREIETYRACSLVLMLESGDIGPSSEFMLDTVDHAFSKPACYEDLCKIFSEENSIKHTQAAEENIVGKHHILLVEDNDINQEVAMGILEDMSISCDIANNGQEAIEKLKQNNREQAYPLILMDCQMPVLDGYKTTQKIRQGLAGEENKSIVIIAMTANAMAGDREKCLQAGMDNYLSKPINDETLCAMLNKYLSDDIVLT